MTHYREKGFTLIELLVVLVIVAATTSLLTQGLQSTWQNFSKLSASNLTQTQAQLPLSWFSTSVHGALLSHPDRPMIEANSEQLTFTSFTAPDARSKQPSLIRWEIVQVQNIWRLDYINLSTEERMSVARFDAPVQFSYWVEQQWQDTFLGQTGQLPKAIALRTSQQTLSTGIIGRPTIADVPPELLLYGEYEFDR